MAHEKRCVSHNFYGFVSDHTRNSAITFCTSSELYNRITDGAAWNFCRTFTGNQNISAISKCFLAHFVWSCTQLGSSRPDRVGQLMVSREIMLKYTYAFQQMPITAIGSDSNCNL
jgi:hypothetical protein